MCAEASKNKQKRHFLKSPNSINTVEWGVFQNFFVFSVFLRELQVCYIS